jgi:hypothetical protein
METKICCGFGVVESTKRMSSMIYAMVSGLSDTPLCTFLKDLCLELGSKELLHLNSIKVGLID